MIDGSRLVDSTSEWLSQKRRHNCMTFSADGQWALPCDTPDTMSFTFGYVYIYLFLYAELTYAMC